VRLSAAVASISLAAHACLKAMVRCWTTAAGTPPAAPSSLHAARGAASSRPKMALRAVHIDLSTFMGSAVREKDLFDELAPEMDQGDVALLDSRGNFGRDGDELAAEL